MAGKQRLVRELSIKRGLPKPALSSAGSADAVGRHTPDKIAFGAGAISTRIGRSRAARGAKPLIEKEMPWNFPRKSNLPCGARPAERSCLRSWDSPGAAG